jgi:hypothetical protein
MENPTVFDFNNSAHTSILYPDLPNFGIFNAVYGNKTMSVEFKNTLLGNGSPLYAILADMLIFLEKSKIKISPEKRTMYSLLQRKLEIYIVKFHVESSLILDEIQELQKACN